MGIGVHDYSVAQEEKPVPSRVGESFRETVRLDTLRVTLYQGSDVMVFHAHCAERL